MFYCLAKGIERIAFVYRPPQREIDDPDVKVVLQLDRSLDGCDDLTIGTGAILVQYFQVDNVCVVRDSPESIETVGLGFSPCSGDDSGDVGTVTVLVGGCARAGKVLAVYDIGGAPPLHLSFYPLRPGQYLYPRDMLYQRN